jgi:hypothetical protein
MPSMSRRAFIFASVAILWASGCHRGERDPEQRGTPTSGSPSASPLSGARYTSAAHGFSVEFPFDGPPKVEELGAQQTAVGRVLATSHSVSRGNTAFDVQVTRYPKASLAKDVPGLLRIERDSAVQGSGARVLRERTLTFAGPDGAPVPGLQLEVELPGDVKAFRATCFVADRSYTLSAAGIASDPALTDEVFQRFVASFRLMTEPP